MTVPTEPVTGLWEEYRHTSEGRLLRQLALTLAPVVRSTVEKRRGDAPANRDVTDVTELIASACESLITSIDRYDVGRARRTTSRRAARHAVVLLDDVAAVDVAAVDDQSLPADVARLGGAQERNRGRNRVRRPRPAGRRVTPSL